MKVTTFILFLLVFSIPQVSLGQVTREPKLIDELGKTNCDDILARVDNFFIQLHNSTATKGLFSLNGAASELGVMLDMEQRLRGAVRQRRYNPDSVTIRRAESDGSLKIQFWLIPSNASASFSDADGLSARFPADFSPFNLRSDMSQICDPDPLEPLTTELLRANPEGQIYVVVNYASPSEKARQLNKATTMLSAYPRSRVRYLLRKFDASWNDYWFVSGRPSVSAFYKRLRLEDAWSY